MSTQIKKFATYVVTVGASVAAVLAVVATIAGSVNAPAGTVAIIGTISGIVAAIVEQARQYTADKLLIRKAKRNAARYSR